MPAWLNHATIAGAANGTTSHTVDPSGTGGTVVAGAGFTPTAGNYLICFAYGAVTFTTPTGYTVPTNGSQVNNGGLYLFQKASAAGGTGDSITSTNNAANYAVVFDFYEYPSGTAILKLAGSINNTGGATGPSITALTGTNTLMAIGGCAISSSTITGTGFATGTSAVATAVAHATTDGYGYALAYVDGSTATSFSDAFNVPAGSQAAERLVVALTVAAGGGTNGSVTAVHASATAAAGVPTVSGSGAANVTAAHASASAAAVVPGVQASTQVSGGGAASSTAQAIPPTVTGQRQPTVAAVHASASAQANPPAVSSGVSATVQAVAATSTAQLIAPVITGQRQPTVAAVAATSTAQAINPVVSASGSVTVQAVAASASGAARPPVVTGQVSSTVLAVMAHADALAQIPAVQAISPNATVSAVAATASASAPAPTQVGPFNLRNITIIAGPISVGWDAAAPTEGWSGDAPTGNQWIAGQPASGWTADTISR